MNLHRCTPVILCGGEGSRLWPLSRTQFPKPFVLKQQDLTLFQATVLRAKHYGQPLIVCGERHRFLVEDQLEAIGQENSRILLENEGKNTAPAIALAALQAHREAQDPLLLIMPSDHHIADALFFAEAVNRALPLADENYLVTFGCVPTAPIIAYGYIETGKPLECGYVAQRFHEKPNQELAQHYLQQGNYFWNSGIFLFKASVYLEALQEFAPAIYTACYAAFTAAKSERKFLRPDLNQWKNCPSQSIDYAIMEHAKNIAVIPLAAGWNDVGSWDAVLDAEKTDENGNATRGDVQLNQVKNCLVHSEHRLVTAVGLTNHIVIETRDAVLVADKNACQEIKSLVATLKTQRRAETEQPSCVHRPWGTYETVEQGPGFLIKCITLKPGGKLSLQKHQYRSEHWIVVQGVATVICGEKTFTLQANESTFIPANTKHRLSNETAEILQLVEVQVGSYLSENDIERFDDCYGRVTDEFSNSINEPSIPSLV